MLSRRQCGFTNFLLNSIDLSSGLQLFIVTIFLQFTWQPIGSASRTKHIKIEIHFVREKVALGKVRVLYVPTSATSSPRNCLQPPSPTFDPVSISFLPTLTLLGDISVYVGLCLSCNLSLSFLTLKSCTLYKQP
jgi:hypothetical protein